MAASTPPSPPSFRFYKPHKRLQPYLSAYFFADYLAGRPTEAPTYPEWGHIRIALGGKWQIGIGRSVAKSPGCEAVISGPTSRRTTIRIEPPAKAAAIGISPLGWKCLIGRSAAELADRLQPLASVFPGHTEPLRRALLDADDDKAGCAALDAFFLSLEQQGTAASPVLLRAHEVMVDPAITTTEQFAEALGCSSRQLSRLTLELFGFSPKLLLRRQRFLRTLMRMYEHPGKPWHELVDGAYYDHPHFIRDFRRFMGMSPTQFQERSLPHFKQVAQLRTQEFGVSHALLAAVMSPAK